MKAITPTNLNETCDSSDSLPVKLPRLAYSIHETAMMLGISDKTVRRLIDRGKLRANKSLRHIRISKTAIERFLESE